MRTKLAFVFILFFLVVFAHAQETKDFVYRQNIGLDWNPTKRIGMSAGYRLTLADNASRFRNSMFSLGMGYDLTKWWKLGGEYRLYTSYARDIHRFQAFSRWDYNFQKIRLLYRLQYQQAQDYFDQEYLQFFPPKRVFRNRLMASYDYNKKLEFYAYTEAFTELKKADLNWYRMRYSIGAEYLYKKRHSFGAELFVNDEFNLKRPEDRITAELSYVFHLDKKSKKKNKSAGKKKAVSE